AARAQGQQQPAVRSKLPDGVVAIIGTEDGIIRPDEDAVWPRKQAFTPRGQPSAVAVKHQDRVGAAVENVDAVARIGGHGGDLCPGPAIRQLRPAIMRLVAKDTAIIVPRSGTDRGITQECTPLCPCDFSSGSWGSASAIPAGTRNRNPAEN